MQHHSEEGADLYQRDDVTHTGKTRTLSDLILKAFYRHDKPVALTCKAPPAPANREWQKPGQPARFPGSALLQRIEPGLSLQLQLHHPKSLWGNGAGWTI